MKLAGGVDLIIRVLLGFDVDRLESRLHAGVSFGRKGK